jgi:hypothetical protein
MSHARSSRTPNSRQEHPISNQFVTLSAQRSSQSQRLCKQSNCSKPQEQTTPHRLLTYMLSVVSRLDQWEELSNEGVFTVGFSQQPIGMVHHWNSLFFKHIRDIFCFKALYKKPGGKFCPRHMDCAPWQTFRPI